MKMTMTEICIHPDDQCPILGELVTKVTVDYEGGGPFVRITQCTDEGSNSIRLDFHEVAYLVKAVNALKAGVD